MAENLDEIIKNEKEDVTLTIKKIKSKTIDMLEKYLNDVIDSMKPDNESGKKYSN